ncbi:MAG: redoxin domain-containing protein [Pirellulaceae bacterium]|nr:redoxin domain-containing protein [Pirellulaceae bacterium]
MRFMLVTLFGILLGLNLQGDKRANAADLPVGFQKLAIGDPAPDFKLPGIDDRDWTLDDFRDANVFMVYFTSNHCPICHAHDPRLMKLVKELTGKSLAIVAINPNSGDGLRQDELGYSKYDDSFEHMKFYAKDEGFTFPYLYDGETQAVAKRYGCLATPHVFIFDRERKLRYQGWFDDSRFPDPSTVKRQDAREAILALLDGKPVPVEETKPFGCSTKWREKIAVVTKDNETWEQMPVTLDSIDAAGVAKLVKNDTEKYRLFNVWSTTCGPCRVEFPGLVRVSRRMGLRKFELITISTDLPEDREAASAFLDKQRAALPAKLRPTLEKEGRTSNNYLYTEASMDSLIQALDPAWEGPQPHTVFVAPGGKVLFRHTGELGEEELLAKLLEFMSTGYQP